MSGDPSSAHDHEDPVRDARWLAQVAAGGPGARDALWSLTGVYDEVFMCHLARRGMDADLAEDTLVRFWTKVVRRAPAFDPQRSNAAAWLWMILLGELSDAWKRELKDRQRLSFGDPEEGEVSAADHDAPPLWAQAPEQDVLLKLCIESAMKALQLEDPEGAKLLWKCSALEWRPRELAEDEGRPVGTIKNILVRVRKLAKVLLEPCHSGRAQPR